jgi:hypothetical protein
MREGTIALDVKSDVIRVRGRAAPRASMDPKGWSGKRPCGLDATKLRVFHPG